MTAHVQWGVGGDKQARTQVNRRRAQLSIHVLTCRLGLGCKVIQGATHAVQCRQLGVGRIHQKSSGCTETGRGLSIHVQLPQSRGASLKVTHARAAATRRPRSHV